MEASQEGTPETCPDRSQQQQNSWKKCSTLKSKSTDEIQCKWQQPCTEHVREGVPSAPRSAPGEQKWLGQCRSHICFSESVTYVLIITHICGEINAEKAIPSLMESMWKPHFLKGFFSGKKKKVLSQLWLWIVKYSTDTASRNNGAATQERLQKPQGEEDVAM